MFGDRRLIGKRYVYRAGVKNVSSPNLPFQSRNSQRSASGCIYDYMDSWSDFECMDTKNAKFPNWVLRHRMPLSGA
jgi:hypothetical protein